MTEDFEQIVFYDDAEFKIEVVQIVEVLTDDTMSKEEKRVAAQNARRERNRVYMREWRKKFGYTKKERDPIDKAALLEKRKEYMRKYRERRKKTLAKISKVNVGVNELSNESNEAAFVAKEEISKLAEQMRLHHLEKRRAEYQRKKNARQKKTSSSNIPEHKNIETILADAEAKRKAKLKRHNEYMKNHRKRIKEGLITVFGPNFTAQKLPKKNMTAEEEAEEQARRERHNEYMRNYRKRVRTKKRAMKDDEQIKHD